MRGSKELGSRTVGVALFLIVITIVAIVMVYPLRVLSVVSIDKMTLEEYTVSGDIVTSGWWVASVLVDSPDEVAFVMKDYTQELLGVKPEGTEAKTQSEVVVNLRPKGSPYYAGIAEVGSYIYHYQGVWDFWNVYKRVFSWYIIPDWDSKHTTYEISAKKDGVLIEDSQIVSVGFVGDWDTTNLDIGSGDEVIKLRNLVEISKGLTQPREDIAIFYSKTGTLVTCREEDLIRQLEYYYNVYYEGTIPRDIDTYAKFYDIAKLDLVTSRPVYLDALTGEHLAVPNWITPFSDEIPPLNNVPLSSDAGLGGAESWTPMYWETAYTGLYNKPLTSVSAYVTLRGSAQIFDTVIWRPPFGNPEITSVQAIGGESGKMGRIIVGFRNVGFTADTFEGGISFTTPGISVVTAPGGIVVDKESTGSLTWTVATGASEVSQSFDGTVSITSMGSNLRDTEDFSITFTPSTNSVDTGSIIGVVAGNKAGTPVKGASVIPDAGTFTITDSQGRFTLTSIPTGDRSITIAAEGYGTRTVTTTVNANQTANLGVIVLDKGFEFPWLYIGIAILVIIIIAFAFQYQKARRRTRGREGAVG